MSNHTLTSSQKKNRLNQAAMRLKQADGWLRGAGYSDLANQLAALSSEVEREMNTLSDKKS